MTASCSVYFVACGVSRLARFNVTAEELSAQAGKVSHSRERPSPPRPSSWAY